MALGGFKSVVRNGSRNDEEESSEQKVNPILRILKDHQSEKAAPMTQEQFVQHLESLRQKRRLEELMEIEARGLEVERIKKQHQAMRDNVIAFPGAEPVDPVPESYVEALIADRRAHGESEYEIFKDINRAIELNYVFRDVNGKLYAIEENLFPPGPTEWREIRRKMQEMMAQPDYDLKVAKSRADFMLSKLINEQEDGDLDVEFQSINEIPDIEFEGTKYGSIEIATMLKENPFMRRRLVEQFDEEFVRIIEKIIRVIR